MSGSAEFVRRHLLTSADVKRAAAEQCAAPLAEAAARVVASFRAGGKLLFCGNGGSAADCQHLAAEFTSALNHDRPRPALGAIALTTDTSFLTANANDFGFDHVFERPECPSGLREGADDRARHGAVFRGYWREGAGGGGRGNLRPESGYPAHSGDAHCPRPLPLRARRGCARGTWPVTPMPSEALW
ncbi:MAG: SIS domain-containing protein [Gemmatimonadetes bacterium]|nr:SIS domain-containing protein [Gemmatimonadota bacterium]